MRNSLFPVKTRIVKKFLYLWSILKNLDESDFPTIHTKRQFDTVGD